MDAAMSKGLRPIQLGEDGAEHSKSWQTLVQLLASEYC
jgi:hypothetical protein